MRQKYAVIVGAGERDFVGYAGWNYVRNVFAPAGVLNLAPAGVYAVDAKLVCAQYGELNGEIGVIEQRLDGIQFVNACIYTAVFRGFAGRYDLACGMLDVDYSLLIYQRMNYCDPRRLQQLGQLWLKLHEIACLYLDNAVLANNVRNVASYWNLVAALVGFIIPFKHRVERLFAESAYRISDSLRGCEHLAGKLKFILVDIVRKNLSFHQKNCFNYHYLCYNYYIE